MDDIYEAGAEYYDGVYAAQKDQADRDFYRGLAQEYGGPVLELGCGTGRITLPLAHDGHHVTGVDASPAMLGVLRRKLADESDEVKQRTRIVQGDMRALSLDERFALVIIPFRPLQHMYTTDDQLAALVNAARHLADRGIFAFDVFFPRLDKVAAGVGDECLDFEWPAGDGSDRIMRRYFVKDEVDSLHLTFSGRFIYRLCGQHAGTGVASSSSVTPAPGCHWVPRSTLDFIIKKRTVYTGTQTRAANTTTSITRERRDVTLGGS